jgi:dolichol-phosphate mannosyltransferase
MRIVEVPVPLIYLEEERSFGGSLDDGRKRLEYYHGVLDDALAAVRTDDDEESGSKHDWSTCGRA